MIRRGNRRRWGEKGAEDGAGGEEKMEKRAELIVREGKTRSRRRRERETG